MACIALGLGVPAAQAGTASYAEAPVTVELGDPVPLILGYDADPGTNQLAVSAVAAGARFADAPDIPPAPTTVADTRCTAEAPVVLTCSLADVLSLAVKLGDGNDTITVGSGLPPAEVNGGLGTDRADYSTRADAVTISLDGTGGADTLTGVENATGGAGADDITGSADANGLAGGPGGDKLNGRDGADVLHGGDGGDTLVGGANDDTLDGGADRDVLVGGAGTDILIGGDGPDEILAADDAVDDITCGPGADSVAADLEQDRFSIDCETLTGLAAAPGQSSGGPEPQAGSDPQQQPVSSGSTVTARAPVPVLAPGVATPGDRTPPSARLRVPLRQRLVNVLARGLFVPVSCSESCGISVAILLDRPTARRLGLAGRSGPAVVGTATARLARAGSKRLRVRMTQGARRALRPVKRGVRVTVQTLVSDASRNGMLLQRRVTLRP